MPVIHVGSGAWLDGSRSVTLPLQSHPKSGSATTSLPRPHISCRAAAAYSRDHSTLYWDMINKTKPSGHTNQMELSVNPYSCLENKIQTLCFSRQAHSFSDDLHLCFLFSQRRRNCFLWCTAQDMWKKPEMKSRTSFLNMFHRSQANCLGLATSPKKGTAYVWKTSKQKNC